MSKYLFVYHGGSVPESEEEIAKVMAAWGSWMESVGSSIIDGGNPVGKSWTVNPDGSATHDGGSNPASGYGLFEAADDQAALEIAKGCPVLASGGSVELAECFDM